MEIIVSSSIFLFQDDPVKTTILEEFNYVSYVHRTVKKNLAEITYAH